MSSTSNHPDFTVRVDGAFDEGGTWVIDVKLTIREGLSRWPAGPEAATRKQKLFDDRLITLALDRLRSRP